MSLGTSNRDGGKTSESGHLRSIYKAITGEVLSGLAVSQRGAGANMSVDIAIGDVIIPRSDATYGHPAFNDAVLNQVIATSDPSNPRRDILVIYIDYANAVSTGISNNTNGVVKVKVVAGTPAGSPVDPTNAAIQSSVGTGNPFSILARIRVGAAVSSIGNSVIDDLRTMASGVQQRGGPLVTQNAELTFPAVASGLVWTGDAYASTRNASMTAGVVYINGLRISIVAVVARAFTASRDTYVDVLSNGDGTGTLVYTEVTNGAAAPALAANSIRIGKVITGATTIAAATSILQTGLDSLSNLYYPLPVGTKSAADTNGWVKKSMGGWNRYEQQVTVSGGVIGANSNSTPATYNLPVGIIDTSYLRLRVHGYGGFLGRIIFGYDNGNVATPTTSIAVNAYNNSGGSITFSGFINVVAETK